MSNKSAPIVPWVPTPSPKPDRVTSILDNLDIGRSRDNYWRRRNRYRFDGRGGRRRFGGRRNRNRTSTASPTTAATINVTDDNRPGGSDGDKEGTRGTGDGTMTGEAGNKSGDGRGDLDHDHDKDGNHLKTEDDDDHDHSEDHEDFSCEPTSSQHSKYIEDNLEMLQKKCSEFHACTMELYNSENFHRVLAGENIQLKNICGLMYANGGGKYTTLEEDECSAKERQAIRQDIGRRLATNLADPPPGEQRASWRELGQCVKRKRTSPSEFDIDVVCRERKNSTFLCDSHELDHMAEEFFNHEIEHLHCSCNAIDSLSKDTSSAAGEQTSGLSDTVRFAIAGGVMGLLVCLIIAVVVLCFRHRKVKRTLKKHQMKYLPSPHDEASAIYQEISEHPNALEALRKERAGGQGYHFLGRPPSLPDRYVKDATRPRPRQPALRDEDDPEYLEPLPDPTPPSDPQANSKGPTVDGSSNSAYDLAKPLGGGSLSPAIKIHQENPYFDLARGENPDEDGGYSTLGRKADGKDEGKGLPLNGGDAVPAGDETSLLRGGDDDDAGGGGGGSVCGPPENASPEEPKYFVLEPENDPGERDPLTTSTVTQL